MMAAGSGSWTIVRRVHGGCLKSLRLSPTRLWSTSPALTSPNPLRTPLPSVNTTGYIDQAAFLGAINPDTNKIPKHLFQGYLNIYNNYFKAPWMPDRPEANPNELN